MRTEPRDELRFHRSPPVRVSSNGAEYRGKGRDSLEPGVVEFITSERVKVAAMVALALALCNADRVVMSVAIVPLSLANGWSRSFAGVVQESLLAVIIPLGLLDVSNSRRGSCGLLWW